MSDDEDYAFYGDPLEPLDNDNYHKQKAPKLEDQVVTDNEGRRRFHGAFTGGFSAGYFNTVGTKEGWTPSTFSSSRVNKAQNVASRTAVDFMDDEDLEAHGIAPQGIRTKTDYEIHERPKRKRVADEEGPIPGDPVLSDLLVPIRETVGIKVLKKFGWKQGQGIGPRVSRKSKRKTLTEIKKLYGCQLPPSKEEATHFSSGDDEEPEVMFAPLDRGIVDFDAEKDNFFGIGYKPLGRAMIFGSVSNPLRMTDNKKKLSIAGHAFGVGAFEEDDDDIYSKEDLSNYDFSLGGPSESTVKKNPMAFSRMDRVTDQLQGFAISKRKVECANIRELPKLPSSFTPKHTPIKRRFNLEEKNIKGLGRHELSSTDRGRILSISDAPSEIRTGVAVCEDENKVKAETQLRIEALLSEHRSTATINYQPYSENPEKQKRYELYCRMKDKGMNDRFHLVQPKTMTEWQKEREISEFDRSNTLFKPLASSIAARFTKATGEENSSSVSGESGKLNEIKMLGQCDVHRDAAKNKMYGKLTQTRVNWHPDPVVCKRFFVTNPYSGSTIVGLPGIKHEKISIFNFLEAPVEQTAGLQNQPVIKDDAPEPMEAQPSSVTEDLPPQANEPPTMDLYKAIFQDSDTDSDKSDDDIEIIDISQASNGVRLKSPSTSLVQQPQNDPSNRDLLSTTSTSLDFAEVCQSTPNIPTAAVSCFKNEFLKVEPPEGKIVFRKPLVSAPPSEATVTKKRSSGIFSNIDFEALNEYRNSSVTPAGSAQSSADSSDEEYGPLPPSNFSRETQSDKAYVSSKKSKKEKKKSKHKKHKKDKKKPKHR